MKTLWQGAICVGICLGTLAFLHPEKDPDPRPANDRGQAKVSAYATVITSLTARALELCRDNEWSRESVEVLNDALRTTEDIEPVRTEILHQAGSIPPVPRISILNVLVDRALQEGDIPLATALQIQVRDAARSLGPDFVQSPANMAPAMHLSFIETLPTQPAAL